MTLALDAAHRIGYAALFVGTLLEGETVLVLAGLAAHQGYLELRDVALVAAAGGFLGDQLLFWIGRRAGPRLALRCPAVRRARRRVFDLVERFDLAVVVGVRFLYGLRTVGPMAIGMTDLPAWRFVLANLLGAAAWAVSFALFGYAAGHAVEAWLGHAERFELAAALAIVTIGATLWLAARLRDAARNARKEASK